MEVVKTKKNMNKRPQLYTHFSAVDPIKEHETAELLSELQVTAEVKELLVLSC